MSRAVPRFKRINPPLPAVGGSNGTVQYRLQGVQEGQLTICTFNYSAAVPAPTSGQLAILLSSISANLLSQFLLCVSSDWAVVSEELIVTHVNTINGAFSTAHAGVAGSRGSPALNTEMAIIVLRESAVKGQHGRGRVSLPGVAAADVTRSRITAVALTGALTTFEANMKLTASDGVNTWTPCITQRSNTTPRLVVGFAPVTSVFFDTLLGTVRRRKIGRGK